ncbi:MAG: hypothetical protein MUC88_26890, partial [Planctomycetes bacterium]|nr:hypothetical protein [Planctomycetota bacterium]
ITSSPLKTINDQAPEKNIAETPGHVARDGREFEYTGYRSLTVIGVASGQPYHFRHKGDRLTVQYHDSFAMMAERDLRLIPGKKG